VIAPPARSSEEVTVEQQLRRYFVGIISFGFTVTWITVGALAAFLGVIGAVTTSMVVPALLDARRARPVAPRRRMRHEPPARSVTTRPLAHEGADELPLVPDEPSLIIGVSN
jgi:hypothetical protein